MHSLARRACPAGEDNELRWVESPHPIGIRRLRYALVTLWIRNGGDAGHDRRLGGRTNPQPRDRSTVGGSFAMTRQQELRTWIVLEGERVVYQGQSCAAAIALITARGLDPASLYVSSNAARLVADMARKAS